LLCHDVIDKDLRTSHVHNMQHRHVRDSDDVYTTNCFGAAIQKLTAVARAGARVAARIVAGAAVARPQHPIDVEGAAPPRPIRGPRARPPGGLVVLLVGASLGRGRVHLPNRRQHVSCFLVFFVQSTRRPYYIYKIRLHLCNLLSGLRMIRDEVSHTDTCTAARGRLPTTRPRAGPEGSTTGSAWDGMVRAIVYSSTTAGELTVTASAAGLKTATVTIKTTEFLAAVQSDLNGICTQLICVAFALHCVTQIGC
jgi:hypothetical protein